MADSDSTTNVKAPKTLSTKPLPTIVKDSISSLNETIDDNINDLTGQLSDLNENFKSDLSVRKDISGNIRNDIISRDNISKNIEELNDHLQNEIVSKDKLSTELNNLNENLISKDDGADILLDSTEGITNKLKNLGMTFKNNLYQSVDKLLGFFSDSYKKTRKTNKKANRRNSKRMKNITKKMSDISWNTDYTNDLLLKLFNTLSNFFSVYEDTLDKEKREKIFTNIKSNEKDQKNIKQFGEQIQKKKKSSSLKSILKGLGFMAAVGLLVYGLNKAYESFEKLNDWWNNTTPQQKWEDVKNKLKEWWDQGWLGPVLGIIGGFLAVKVAGAMGIPPKSLITKTIKGAFKHAGTLWAFYSAYKGVQAYSDTLKNGGSQADAIIAGAKGFFKQLLSPITMAIDMIFGEGTGDEIIDKAVEFFEKIGEKIGEFIAYIVSGEAWKDVKKGLINMATSVSKWFKDVWNNIKKWWNSFNIKDSIINLTSVVGDWFKEKWNDIKNLWDNDKSAWENITNFVNKITEWVSNWFSNLWKKVKGWFGFGDDEKEVKKINNDNLTPEENEILNQLNKKKEEKTLASFSKSELEQWKKLHDKMSEDKSKISKISNDAKLIKDKSEISKIPTNMTKSINSAKGIINGVIEKTSNLYTSMQTNINNQPVTSQTNVNNSNLMMSQMSSNDRYNFGSSRIGDIYNNGFIGN